MMIMFDSMFDFEGLNLSFLSSVFLLFFQLYYEVLV